MTIWLVEESTYPDMDTCDVVVVAAFTTEKAAWADAERREAERGGADDDAYYDVRSVQLQD